MVTTKTKRDGHKVLRGAGSLWSKEGILRSGFCKFRNRNFHAEILCFHFRIDPKWENYHIMEKDLSLRVAATGLFEDTSIMYGNKEPQTIRMAVLVTVWRL